MLYRGRTTLKVNREGVDYNDEGIDHGKAFALLINVAMKEATHTMGNIIKYV